MRLRCNGANQPGYKYYGGKGVKVCAEWDTYPAFRDWAHSHGYTDELSIDRIDPNGHYDPANCEWVTPTENTRRMFSSRKSA
jgi:hypothetical protein